jgi:hypothetical protein
MAARLAYTNLLTASGVVISSSSEATGYVDDNLASPGALEEMAQRHGHRRSVVEGGSRRK